MKPPAIVIALLLALAGCASTGSGTSVASAPLSPPAPVLAPSTTVATQVPQLDVAGPINGYYRGDLALVQDSAPPCPDAARGSLEIGDKKLYFPYTPDVIFVAPISGDGRVHAMAGGYVLDGTMVEGILDVSIAGPTTTGCRSSLMFHRLDSF